MSPIASQRPSGDADVSSQLVAQGVRNVDAGSRSDGSGHRARVVGPTARTPQRGVPTLARHAAGGWRAHQRAVDRPPTLRRYARGRHATPGIQRGGPPGACGGGHLDARGWPDPELRICGQPDRTSRRERAWAGAHRLRLPHRLGARRWQLRRQRRHAGRDRRGADAAVTRDDAPPSDRGGGLGQRGRRALRQSRGERPVPGRGTRPHDDERQDRGRRHRVRWWRSEAVGGGAACPGERRRLPRAPHRAGRHPRSRARGHRRRRGHRRHPAVGGDGDRLCQPRRHHTDGQAPGRAARDRALHRHGQPGGARDTGPPGGHGGTAAGQAWCTQRHPGHGRLFAGGARSR